MYDGPDDMDGDPGVSEPQPVAKKPSKAKSHPVDPYIKVVDQSDRWILERIKENGYFNYNRMADKVEMGVVTRMNMLFISAGLRKQLVFKEFVTELYLE